MFVYVAKFFETIVTAPPNEYFIRDIFLSGNKLGESLYKTSMKNAVLTELLKNNFCSANGNDLAEKVKFGVVSLFA